MTKVGWLSTERQPRAIPLRVKTALAPLLLGVCLAFGNAPSVATESVALITGMRLDKALQLLQRAGLNIVYSSRIVDAEMRLVVVPQSNNLESIAQKILAEHQLNLQRLGSGTLIVVRQRAADSPDTLQSDTRESLPLIEIYASRYRIGTQLDSNRIDVLRSEMQQLPGLDEDVLRVTRFFPGTANNGFSAKTHVRGGRDDETLVLFDDIPLYSPYHFKDFGAVLGLFDPAVTRQADLFTGVFPVRYGSRLSAVMSIEPREASEEPEHEIGLSMLSLRGLSTGKVSLFGHETEWLVSARTSVVKEVAELLGTDRYQPEFSDALLRGKITLGDWSLTLGGLFLDDRLRIETDDDEVVFLQAPEDEATARYRDSLLWMHADRNWLGLDWHLSLANSERHTNRLGEIYRPGNVTGDVTDFREANSQFLRLEARSPSGWSSGIEAQRLRAEYEYFAAADFSSELAVIFGKSSALRRSARSRAQGDSVAWYGSYSFPIDQKWRVDAGLRVGHHDFQSRLSQLESISTRRLAFDVTALSPRLAVEYAWNDSLKLRASAGQMTQADRPDELLIPDGDASFQGLQTATQFVLGLEKELSDYGVLRLETYRKEIGNPAPRYENLLDPLTLLPELEIDRFRLDPDSALIYGIEVSAQVELSPKWSIWGAYTWAEAKDRFGSEDITRSWNQQHSILGGVTWKHGAWAVSMNSIWHSGWRRTLIENPAFSSNGADPLIVLKRNATDWPVFFSTDLRIMWQRPFQDSVLQAYVDVINASQHSNPCCTEIAISNDQSRLTLSTVQRDWLPRYALAGIIWEF